MQTHINPDQILDTALSVIASNSDWRAVLDELPVPIYTTDAEGAVTYWNRACLDFAGRQPELGSDRWCVTWKIYTTTGEFMPHDQCPMAEAVKKREVVRGKVAIAMRPDGSRRAFCPYPTPLYDADGNFSGAINLLVDVTEEQSEALGEQAGRCRRLADAMYTRETKNVLNRMADRFDQTAFELRSQRAS